MFVRIDGLTDHRRELDIHPDIWDALTVEKQRDMARVMRDCLVSESLVWTLTDTQVEEPTEENASASESEWRESRDPVRIAWGFIIAQNNSGGLDTGDLSNALERAGFPCPEGWGEE